MYRIYMTVDGWIFKGRQAGETSWEILLSDVTVLQVSADIKNDFVGSLILESAEYGVHIPKDRITFSVAAKPFKAGAIGQGSTQQEDNNTVR